MEGPADANNINVLINYVQSLQAPVPQFYPRTVEEVFRDFRGRRAGIVKALTTDVEEFCLQCDPDKDHLCLYGLPSELWEVNVPAEDVPPELPEPLLGINFGREGMQEKDWLLSVAEHSDAWLLSVAYFFASRFGFNKADRMRLFNMISDLPTVFEVVSGTAKENQEKTEGSNHSITKSASSSKEPQQEPESQGKYSKVQQNLVLHALSLIDFEDMDDDDDDDDDDAVDGKTLCGACGEKYASDEFWVCCDICEKWFHGKCVDITPARAEHIKQYKCPACSKKRART